MSQGILLISDQDPDPALLSRAKNRKLAIEQSQDYKIPFEKTLILEAGTRIPWDLLPAAWNFLNRWDSAVPLWRYGVTAADVGSDHDRKITIEIVRDLRVLLHSYELLFVRKNKAGAALIESWNHEIDRGQDKRLAFLRAFYLIKPRLCILPISWLAEVRASSGQVVKSRKSVNRRIARRSPRVPMVKVEIAPGEFVKCYKGDEERVKKFHQEQARSKR